jgi:hypothetical protein
VVAPLHCGHLQGTPGSRCTLCLCHPTRRSTCSYQSNPAVLSQLAGRVTTVTSACRHCALYGQAWPEASPVLAPQPAQPGWVASILNHLSRRISIYDCASMLHAGGWWCALEPVPQPPPVCRLLPKPVSECYTGSRPASSAAAAAGAAGGGLGSMHAAGGRVEYPTWERWIEANALQRNGGRGNCSGSDAGPAAVHRRWAAGRASFLSFLADKHSRQGQGVWSIGC